VDLIPEFEDNDHKCDESLLYIKGYFPDIRRNTSDYSIRQAGKEHSISLYQVDAIYYISIAAEFLQNVTNRTKMSEVQKILFDDAFYFINHNFGRTFMQEFDADRQNLQEFFKRLIKNHFVNTFSTFGALILFWFLITAVMLFYYSAIFRGIALCFSIFGLILDLQTEDLKQRVERFKENHLKVRPRNFEVFINKDQDDDQDEDIESWEVVYKSAMQQNRSPSAHNKTLLLKNKSKEEEEFQEVLPPTAKGNPPNISQVHPFTQKEHSTIEKSAGQSPPQPNPNESPEDFPLKESNENSQKPERRHHRSDTTTKQASSMKQSKNKQLNKVITSKKSRVIYSTGTRHEEYKERDAPWITEDQGDDKSNKIYKGTQNYYPGLFIRLACTGLVLFPVPVVIIFMDYLIYSEYTFQADFLNRNMEIRSSLHYLNALNYELISTGIKPTGRTLEQPDKEVDLVEHLIRHEDTTLAKYMAYTVSDFPSYLKQPIEKFLRYSQGDICEMGGVTFISYLKSCSLLSPSLQLFEHSPEGFYPRNFNHSLASQKRFDLGYQPSGPLSSRPDRRER